MENKNNIWWIPKIEAEFWEDELKRFEKDILWGIYVSPGLAEDCNVKYAWVEIDSQRKMIGVDNKTLKGYVMVPREGGGPDTWKLPLEEQKYDTFIRWCTTFDL